MSLRVDLAERKAFWHPGETVLGTVVLKPSPRLDVDKVFLVFEGRVKSKTTVGNGNSRSTYRTWVTLFRQQVSFLQGPFTLASDREWPFAVQFPLDCSNATGPMKLDKSKFTRFNSDRRQPLPPTMNSSNVSLFSANTECYVHYRIMAHVACSSALKSDLEHESRLTLMPYREEQFRFHEPAFLEYPRKQITASMHLSPEVGDRELTFKEKLKSSMSSKSVPSVAYNITTRMPLSAVARASIPIYLSLSLASGGTIDELPPVDLKSFTLDVVVSTQQVTDGGSGVFNQSVSVESWQNDVTIGSWTGTALIGDMLDLRTLDPSIGKKWSAIPDFTTFTLARWYTLKLTLKIECARKQSTIVVMGSRAPLRLLSGFVNPVMPAIGIPVDGMGPPPEEQIPSYGEATKA